MAINVRVGVCCDILSKEMNKKTTYATGASWKCFGHREYGGVVKTATMMFVPNAKDTRKIYVHLGISCKIKLSANPPFAIFVGSK